MRNIEIFEVYAGYILGKLFQHFPLPKEINAEDVVGAVEIDNGLSESARREIAGHTIKWLRRAGYIEPETADALGFRGSLTTLGLECMQALPGALKPRMEPVKTEEPAPKRTPSKSFGEQLSEMVKDGIKAAGAEKVQELASEVLTVGTLLKLGAFVKGIFAG